MVQGLVEYMPSMHDEHQVTLRQMLPDDINSSYMGTVANESYRVPIRGGAAGVDDRDD